MKCCQLFCSATVEIAKSFCYNAAHSRIYQRSFYHDRSHVPDRKSGLYRQAGFPAPARARGAEPERQYQPRAQARVQHARGLGTHRQGHSAHHVAGSEATSGHEDRQRQP